MDKCEIVINRLQTYSGSIVGELSVNGTKRCYTLEKPWWWNEQLVSCVPNGRYPGTLRYDKSDGWRIQLVGVPNRTGVQIHVGNYPSQTQGCVLVGTSYGVNKVFNSVAAYAKLKEAFYGSGAPMQSPWKSISVEFKGIQATPPGDYRRPGSLRTE